MGQKIARNSFYAVWAVFMAALTYVLGGAPLKVLRRSAGRLPFWTAGVLISGAMLALKFHLLAGAFFSLVLLIGIFCEFEEMQLGFLVCTFFTLMISSLMAAGGFVLWMSVTGPTWSQTMTTWLETLFKPLTTLNPNLTLNMSDLIAQLPSVVLILWLVTLYLAVLLESRLVQRDPESAQGSTLRQQLFEIKMPDPVVWVFIAALLGAFGGFKIAVVESISVNVLNVCFLLFFFQGVAVVTSFFDRLRMGVFWQGLFMLLIVVHLFLFVSVLGLVDYWMDFRERLKKTPDVKSKA